MNPACERCGWLASVALVALAGRGCGRPPPRVATHRPTPEALAAAPDASVGRRPLRCTFRDPPPRDDPAPRSIDVVPTATANPAACARDLAFVSVVEGAPLLHGGDGIVRLDAALGGAPLSARDQRACEPVRLAAGRLSARVAVASPWVVIGSLHATTLDGFDGRDASRRWDAPVELYPDVLASDGAGRVFVAGADARHAGGAARPTVVRMLEASSGAAGWRAAVGPYGETRWIESDGADCVLVGAHVGERGRVRACALTLLDARDGAVVWRREFAHPEPYGTCVFARGGEDAWVIPDGHPGAVKVGLRDGASRGAERTTRLRAPFIARAEALYTITSAEEAPGDRATLEALDARTGEARWRRSWGAFHSIALAGRWLIAQADEDSLQAYDVRTGELAWRTYAGDLAGFGVFPPEAPRWVVAQSRLDPRLRVYDLGDLRSVEGGRETVIEGSLVPVRGDDGRSVPWRPRRIFVRVGSSVVRTDLAGRFVARVSGVGTVTVSPVTLDALEPAVPRAERCAYAQPAGPVALDGRRHRLLVGVSFGGCE